MLFLDTDYMEGAHPLVMKRLVETNLEHTVGYGSDDYTREAKQLIRNACEAPEALVQFMVGGTQTNATVIDALLHRHEGVLAAETAHINVHESGAIEHSGHKVLTLPSHNGKVCPQEVEQWITNFYSDDTYEHMVAPGVLYVTQPTELGTLYSKAELTELSEVCHKHNIPLYLDGARLGYALASDACDMTLADVARLCDVFYIGGTKVGCLFGEAVVARDPKRLPHFFPLVKQHGSLMAKGRLQGVQFGALFTPDEQHPEAPLPYLQIARHAVTLAKKLRKALEEKGYQIAIDSPTNQQFVLLPNEVMDRLREIASFENWGPRGEKETLVRMVTSWATSEEELDALIEQL